jgi:hypothetical protein
LLDEEFCGLQDHRRYRATSFAKASCNDRRGYCWLPPKDFGSLVLISMLFVEHEREIMPTKPPRAVMRVADLFLKRGSNQKEMSHRAASVRAKKNRRIQRTLRLLLVSSVCAQSKTTT